MESDKMRFRDWDNPPMWDDLTQADKYRLTQRDFGRECRRAWVAFAAAAMTQDAPVGNADTMLAEFVERFGPREESK